MKYEGQCQFELVPNLPKDNRVVTFRPELTISVVSVGRDQLQVQHGSEQTIQQMKMPLPESGPRITMMGLDSLTRTGRPVEAPPQKELWQIEDWFANIGLELPSRTKAKDLSKQVMNQRVQIEDLQRKLFEQGEHYQTENSKIDLVATDWRAYAEALEASIERKGGRISSKMFATRPEPRA